MKKSNFNVEDRLLATHVADNPDFENACLTGNAKKIMYIVDEEIRKNRLYTKGANKLREDVFKMTQGKDKVPAYIGSNILAFIWNSRLSGIGLAVC